MAEQRSLIAHASFREARDKFDNFVLGVNVAICAYIAQTMTFGKIGINIETMFLLSLLVFATAAILGFKRIEWTVVGYGANHLWLEFAEKGQEENKKIAQFSLDRAKRKSEIYYKWRNRVMLGGFLFYLLAKVSTAYVH